MRIHSAVSRIFCLLSLFPAAALAADLSLPSRPNILIILSDDCGYNEFSMHGGKIRTPQIDSLAADGVRFTNGYVTGCVCSPSRAGLLTGRYQQRFGHEYNIPPKMSNVNGLPTDETTIADMLVKNGYRTIAIGKWHLGYAPKFHPMERGFTDFYGFLQGARSYLPLEKPTVLNQLLLDRDPVYPEKLEYMTDHLADKAVEYINASKDGPFFIYLALNATHGPNQALASDLKAADGNKITAMTLSLDRAVGKVLEALRKNDLSENTLVVFLNDNGGAQGHDNSPLRGMKGTCREGGIRVPFVMRWPGVIPEATVENRPVISLDLFPTIMAAAGITIPDDNALDGVDLLPYFRGEKSGQPHDVLYWKFGSDWAVREGNLKLTVTQMKNSPKVQLFDLCHDISETTDLAQERPEDVKRLRQLYNQWRATHRATPWADAGGVKK